MGCFRPFLNPWSKVDGPTRAEPRVIGAYWAGCLDGGASLPPDGPGYQMMRLSRARFYAHPSMISFVQDLGKTLKSRGQAPLLVGDLGQARGGPTLSGHTSHQSGLDADLWYWFPPGAEKRSLTLDERETLDAPSMVLPNGLTLDSALWTRDKVALLKLAASFPSVERIFVHPVIKRELCQSAGMDRAWLSKIRPWTGHDDHFHVRLRCPGDSPDCKAQEAPAAEDGCASELDEWFVPKPPEKPSKAKKPILPDLPPACAEVLSRP